MICKCYSTNSSCGLTHLTNSFFKLSLTFSKKKPPKNKNKKNPPTTTTKKKKTTTKNKTNKTKQKKTKQNKKTIKTEKSKSLFSITKVNQIFCNTLIHANLRRVYHVTKSDLGECGVIFHCPYYQVHSDRDLKYLFRSYLYVKEIYLRIIRIW